VSLLLLVLPACGYHFAGTSVSLPEDVKSVHVGDIGNETRYPGADKMLAFALEDAINRWGTLRLAEDAGDSDAVLDGRLRSVELRAVSFDQADLALQYEIVAVADFTLIRNRDGKVLWEIDGLRQIQEYSAAANVVVTSSSQFQQQTLAANDLPRLTEVQLAESERRLAVQRLLRDMARDAYALMTEGF
jgi:hypothetical protein